VVVYTCLYTRSRQNPLVLNSDGFRGVAIPLSSAIHRILAIADLAGLARVKPKAKTGRGITTQRSADGDGDEGDHDAPFLTCWHL
jgi:hypothetical protein